MTNNKVKIPEKAKKIWMAVKKKKNRRKKNKPSNKAELWKCILWRNIIELGISGGGWAMLGDSKLLT